MIKSRSLLAALLIASAPLLSRAQQEAPVTVVNVLELTGAGAIAGSNFNNGVKLAFKEINAAGGILGKKIEIVTLDTQTKPEVAVEMVRKAVEMKPYAVMGPVFSDQVLITMKATQRAEIPNFVGAEADEITRQGNPYVFRTSFAQSMAMPKLAAYIKNIVRAKSVAIVWVDNAFGKGGRDAMTTALAAQGIAVAADIVTEQQQADFAGVVLKLRQSNAGAAFVYLNEEESARFLREAQQQGYDKPLLGETTLIGQQVIDIAGEAAKGIPQRGRGLPFPPIRGHVGLTPHALVKTIQAFDNKFIKEYKQRSDHNGMKGYTAAYVLKTVTEKVGKFDPKEFAKAMKGVTLLAKDQPGLLLDVKYDDKGDLDRASFIVRVSGRKHQFLATLPPVSPELAALSGTKRR